jgi:hypothetical protein
MDTAIFSNNLNNFKIEMTINVGVLQPTRLPKLVRTDAIRMFFGTVYKRLNELIQQR